MCANFRANRVGEFYFKETFVGNPEYLHKLFLGHFVRRFEKVSSKYFLRSEKIDPIKVSFWI